MEENEAVKRIERRPPRGSGGEKTRRFTTGEKLKVIRLHLEEGFSMALVCQELNVSKSSLGLWLQAYRLGGEAGLQPGIPGPRKHRLPEPITEKIVEIKQQNPAFGIKRISQLLRRWFFLPASPETVRQRLHEAELMAEWSPPKRRNIT